MSTLDFDFAERLYADYLANPSLQATENAVSHNGLLKSLETRQSTIDNDYVFSIDLTTDAVSNQKASGRCWMFAALNTFRHKLISDFKLENFELSQAHTFFWDKYEKSNWFMEQIIATADLEIGSRKVKFLLDTPQQDGGQWDMIVSIFQKYGVVPQYVMPESASSSNSKVLNNLSHPVPAVSSISTLTNCSVKMHKSCVTSLPKEHLRKSFKHKKKTCFKKFLTS